MKSLLSNPVFGLLAGAVLGGIATRDFLEGKIRAEVELELDSLKSSYEQSINMMEQRMDGMESSMSDIESTLPEVVLADVVQGPDYLNTYRDTLTFAEPDEPEHVPYVEHGKHDYAVTYIEDDDFNDEDGREKMQIDILMNNEESVFMLDGESIDDWDERLGDSILVDFYTKCPPGSDQVLYVRNHRTNIDYEVVRVVP